MRIRFMATTALVEYHTLDGGRPVDLRDGEETDFSAEKAGQIFADFPDNFALVLDETPDVKAIEEPPAHRMVTAAPEAKTHGKWRRR